MCVSHRCALWAAAPALRGDREVVLAAVGQSGLALRYASAGLRGDEACVLAATAQNPTAIAFVDEAWWGTTVGGTLGTHGVTHSRTAPEALFPMDRRNARQATLPSAASRATTSPRGLRHTPLTRLQYSPTRAAKEAHSELEE